MLKRFTILIALVLMLTAVLSAQAETMEDGVFCGDLQATDCQILRDNAAVMDQVFSAAIDISMDLATSAEAAANNMSLRGAGNGALAVDPALVDEMQSEEAGDMAAALEPLLTAITGEFTLSLSGASADEPFEMSLDLLLKDGKIVFNAAAMSELTGDSMEGLEWFGVDISGALDEVLQEAGIGAAPAEHDSMMDDGPASGMMVTRLDDSVLAGVPVAVFETSLAASALESMLAAETDDPAMSISGAISSRNYIGLSDHFSYRLELTGELTLPDGEHGAGTTLVMDVGVEMSAFNQPVSVEIPEDALVFPLAMMLQMNSQ